METAEYLTKVKKHIDEVIRENIKTGTDVSESRYIDIALQYTKALYANETERNGTRKKHFWSKKDLSEILALWEGIRPELQKHIPESIMKYRSRKMVSEINAASAEALISAAMKEAGLKYAFFPQAYRAKVHVKLSQKNKVVIYLNYKKIREELPKAIESLKVLVSTLDSMGTGTSIQKIMWYENF